jgi:hypothetical protein
LSDLFFSEIYLDQLFFKRAIQCLLLLPVCTLCEFGSKKKSIEKGPKMPLPKMTRFLASP